MKRLLGGALFFAGFVVFFAAAVGLQRVQTNRLKGDASLFHDWLYIPDSRYVQLTVAGYDHFGADFLWLRSIQTFGQWYAKKEDIPRLMPYFEVTTDLDPKFLDVYSFGNLVIGEEAGDHVKGLAILDKGIQNNPMKYRPAFEGAFFSFWTMNDPQRAKYYVARAIKAPDCPDFVRGWTGYFDLKMGRYIAAYLNLFADYTKFYNEANGDLTTVRFRSLRRSIRSWIEADLRTKAIEFKEKKGRYPTSVAELEAERAFADVEWPDWARMSQAIRAFESGPGKYPADRNELEDFAKKFLRKGWATVPNDPCSDNPNFQIFRFWPGQEPMTTPPKATQPIENTFFVLSDLEMAKHAVTYLATMNGILAQYRAKQPAGICPPEENLDRDVFQGTMNALPEPWGGKWEFDASKCEFRSSTHPNLRDEYYVSPN